MKRFSAFLTLVSFYSLTAATTVVYAFQCNVCHSKNPAQVAMHKAVQTKEIGCFECHKVGEKLMGKAQPTDRGSLLARRASEPLCVECHVKN